MPRCHNAARAVPAAARVAYEPASTRYQTGPLPLCGIGVTSAGTPASAAKRSACASALSSDAYAASWTVQPSVSSLAGGGGGRWRLRRLSMEAEERQLVARQVEP